MSQPPGHPRSQCRTAPPREVGGLPHLLHRWAQRQLGGHLKRGGLASTDSARASRVSDRLLRLSHLPAPVLEEQSVHPPGSPHPAGSPRNGCGSGRREDGHPEQRSPLAKARGALGGMAWPWAAVREQSPARGRSRPWAGGKGRNGSRGDVHGEDGARLSARPSPGAAAHTAVEPASTTVGLGHPEAEARWCFWGKRRRPHSGHPWGLGSGGSDLPASRGPRPAETHAARCPCLPHRLSTWRATRSTRSPPPWSRGGKVTGGWAHGGRATPGRGGAL